MFWAGHIVSTLVCLSLDFVALQFSRLSARFFKEMRMLSDALADSNLTPPQRHPGMECTPYIARNPCCDNGESEIPLCFSGLLCSAHSSKRYRKLLELSRFMFCAFWQASWYRFFKLRSCIEREPSEIGMHCKLQKWLHKSMLSRQPSQEVGLILWIDGAICIRSFLVAPGSPKMPLER